MNTNDTTLSAGSGRLPGAARYAAADIIRHLEAAAENCEHWAKLSLKEGRERWGCRAAAYRDAADIVRRWHSAPVSAAATQPKPETQNQ